LGARVPKADELPDVLRPLLEKNVVHVRNDPDFHNDMNKLIKDIRGSQGYAEDDITTEHFEPKTVYIAEGPFWMGSEPGEGIPGYETPRHEVTLPAYRIGKCPVTNAQYEVFLNETGRLAPQGRGWEGQRIREGMENSPILGITWQEALDYCEWLCGKTGRQYTLPDEAQWEKACRGGDEWRYPWGDELDQGRCNQGNPQIAPVEAYPAQNDFGLFDLVGNVRQWTVTLWGAKRTAPDLSYAYPWKADRRNDRSASREIYRVVRGSGHADPASSCRCSARRAEAPEVRGNVSFRVAIRL
jgi:formylglycine-generating enzyme required for sulfatase activity